MAVNSTTGGVLPWARLPSWEQQQLETLAAQDQLSGVPPQVLSYIIAAEGSTPGAINNSGFGSWFGLSKNQVPPSVLSSTTHEAFDTEAKAAALDFSSQLSFTHGDLYQSEVNYQGGKIEGMTVFQELGAPQFLPTTNAQTTAYSGNGSGGGNIGNWITPPGVPGGPGPQASIGGSANTNPQFPTNNTWGQIANGFENVINPSFSGVGWDPLAWPDKIVQGGEKIVQSAVVRFALVSIGLTMVGVGLFLIVSPLLKKAANEASKVSLPGSGGGSGTSGTAATVEEAAETAAVAA